MPARLPASAEGGHAGEQTHTPAMVLPATRWVADRDSTARPPSPMLEASARCRQSSRLARKVGLAACCRYRPESITGLPDVSSDFSRRLRIPATCRGLMQVGGSRTGGTVGERGERSMGGVERLCR